MRANSLELVESLRRHSLVLPACAHCRKPAVKQREGELVCAVCGDQMDFVARDEQRESQATENQVKTFRSRMTLTDWALTAFVLVSCAEFTYEVLMWVWQWIQAGGVQ